ncbi:MBL fold metallo-hydrolase [Aurantibacter aestuarii]|uniref:MBL fold metallo-hydrolase n=1 Tax=Aurantibacter aestuarii TaxID=1266046 RepID=A0A2T1N8A6_9FLAO|nr:MBL fold metallo-hydrolase [Aurantibacter aestuarii]PSG88082.1 MBL fold metallo-hydrolase [Aurantibacter aestuarii]
MKNLIMSMILLSIVSSCKTDEKERRPESTVTTEIEVQEETIITPELRIKPIEHASLILEYGEHVIYVDPNGSEALYKGYKKPSLILITDIHGDHLSPETLDFIDTEGVKLVVPNAVKEKLPDPLKANSIVLNNGNTTELNGINIEAVPMYNLRPEALKFHEKGRGNGYILTLGGERIYISGDTEDIPEMRNLKGIDKAFICMNLPYTMTVESAASAVMDFEPKEVYPYHYRGTDGFSNVEKFKMLVNSATDNVKVIQLDWYPNKDDVK